jgi:hypothetical protein
MKVFTASILFFLLLSFLFMGCNVDPIPTPTDPPTETTPPGETPGPPAGSFSISGRITFPSLNNQDFGLPGVNLEILGSSYMWDITTDDDGNYELSNIPPGEYTINPSRQGWQFTPELLVVTITADDVNYRNFEGGAADGYILDPWGYIWESQVRTATNWNAANSNCTSMGGRLPTPTEVFRNNLATGSGILPATDSTTYFWTNIPAYAGAYITIRTSNGSTTYYSATSNISYRCVWPLKDEATFKDAYIYSDPGDPGFQIEINGQKFFMDTKSRPRLTYNAALREAAFYKAFIPTESMMTAAIKAGLPNGLGLGGTYWHWTSDHEGWNGTQFLVGIVCWSEIDTAFDDTNSTYSSWNYITNGYWHHFRLMGLTDEVSPNPSVISNKWVDTNSKLTTTTVDESASSFVDAIDTCFQRGGHLPTHQELVMLIQAGLPGGTDTWLWTAEFHSGDYVGINKWLDVDPDCTGYYSTYLTHSTRVASTIRPFRTVYYPIDAFYTGPTVDQSHTGLYSVSHGSAKIWTDMSDRPPVTFAEAVKICHDLGGHLATKRDMVELIRSGLPNGMNNWIWTADQAYYYQVEVVKWTGVETDFQDVYGSGENDDSYQITNDTSTVRPFRCVWTNELRAH